MHNEWLCRKVKKNCQTQPPSQRSLRHCSMIQQALCLKHTDAFNRLNATLLWLGAALGEEWVGVLTLSLVASRCTRSFNRTPPRLSICTACRGRHKQCQRCSHECYCVNDEKPNCGWHLWWCGIRVESSLPQSFCCTVIQSNWWIICIPI